MQKTLLIIVIALAFASVGKTQKKTFTMDEAIIGYRMGLYPKSIYGSWQPNTNYITYNEGNKVIKFNAHTRTTEDFFTLTKLNNILRKNQEDTLKYGPYISWISEEKIICRNGQSYLIFNVKNLNLIKKITVLPNDANIDYEPNATNLMFAVTNKNSLYIINEDKRIEVKKSESDDLVYGQTVSRSEFGINKGTFWSPKGNLLAYYIKNNKNVKQYPIVDITTRIAETDMLRYPMAGMTSEQIYLGVFNPKTNRHIYIEKENAESEQYLTNVTWSPDEKCIYIQILNREQNHMKMNVYNATSGAFIKTLFEEKHSKYVEPYKPITFVPNKNNEFVYQSRTNGYKHLYLYNTDGKLLNHITKGEYEVTNVLGFDKKGQSIFYTSTEESPIERHHYKINIYNSSKKTKLTSEKGTHYGMLSSNGLYILDKYSSTTIPSVVQLINTSNNKKHSILKAENPLSEYKLGEMKIGTTKAADGSTDLYYRLIKPIDFDSTKKYPTIVYVYGGPHTQLIKNNWNGGISLWQQYMAQRGYIMFTIDNRGSANRGLEFENVIHRNCGKNEMADQLKGIEFLKSLPYIDTSRIGVHGWSYGGFMTTSLLTHHPEIYKVGVAGGPVIDWKYYEIMYGERYMDTPKENPEGYKSASLLPMAQTLSRKLLIIHGYIDPVVVIQHSLQFMRECIKHNKQVDYFIYPRSEHNVRGKDRIHLMQKVTNYFDDYLK